MIKFFQDLSKNDVAEVGGKGASLGELTRAGIPVPPGFVVTVEAYRTFAESEISQDAQEKLLAAFDQLGAQRVAVRSSAVAEDSSTASWAGQLESYLNVTRDNLIESIKLCWQSIQADRAQMYAKEQGVTKEQQAVAVVVQKMVNAEAAGVMFSVNPLTGNTNEVMIEAGLGLGEYVVQGVITPDNFIIAKSSKEMLYKEINKQEKLLTFSNGVNQDTAISSEKQEQQKITDSQVRRLAVLAEKIEQHYGKPQDIEWAVENDTVYIVQSRPITTLNQVSNEEKRSTTVDATALLSGLGASHGVVVGPVRVITDLSQLHEVREGEILVTQKTTPDFVEAFGKVAGVITDEGGITCHAAIVSRELGIPSVVGTKSATTTLKNGQIVTVDGFSGAVYDDKVEVTVGQVELAEYQKLSSTGDPIEDLLLAIAHSVNDVSELWPLPPVKLLGYIDVDQAIDIYRKLQELQEKGITLEEIAKVMEHPTKLRLFLLNTGISGMKVASIKNIAGITKDNKIEFVTWVLELITYLCPKDPVCLQGTNRVWSNEQVDGYINNAVWVPMTDNYKRLVNVLSTSFITYIWAFYWDYFPCNGVEVYGPYEINNQRLTDDKLVLIRDHFDLRPDEIWSVAKKAPYKRIVLSQSYDTQNIALNFGNRIANKESLSPYNNHFSLEVDGGFVTQEEDIADLIKQLNALAKEQTDYVNTLDDFEKVRKGGQLAYYGFKDFYNQYWHSWNPIKTIEESIERLGRQFMDAPSGKNMDIETKKKFFDPRNDFLN